MRVGINGFGRIGRTLYRVNMEADDSFCIPVINDINPDPANIAYLLNYDTTYGNLEKKFTNDGLHISNGELEFDALYEKFIDDVDWGRYGVDIVVDASGKKENLLRAKEVIRKNPSVKKVVITHSPDEVDFTMVIGANEDQLLPSHDVISSSICDATAIAPVMKCIMSRFNLNGAAITTVHPMLSYQNVLDGQSVSWFDPSQTYTHYALGRSVFNTIIPKPTTAIEATCKVIGVEPSSIAQFSYRTPNTIVASADITLFLEKETNKDEIIALFEEYIQEQKHKILYLNYEPINSLDMKGMPYSAIVDARWINVAGGRTVKIVLWYDNEWGYSSRVIDQLKLISKYL